ncbi:reverse transcriptase domain-containing protein [Schlesneria sp. DSM 10557]|uniref:reverse transcriptase domain-containing protein n=1 Tax=Schlesneria sp. DSM 10557 TaxID=3044399 RepID=UPI0035A00521
MAFRQPRTVSFNKRFFKSSNRDGADILSAQLWVPTRSLGSPAVTAAQGFIAEGYRWVVDLDLEKFFDRVNHDILMGRIAKRVNDPRLSRLIRAFLNAGVPEDGLVNPTDEGTPQGGPLSPLLSNIVLDDLDQNSFDVVSVISLLKNL